jgi:excisionase family DNA binding protein
MQCKDTKYFKSGPKMEVIKIPMTDILFTPLRLDEMEILIERACRKVFNELKNVDSIIDEDKFIGIKDAAKLLNLSVPSVYTLVHKRQIPFYKRRQKLYFKRSELLRWIEAGRRKTVSENEQQRYEISRD